MTNVDQFESVFNASAKWLFMKQKVEFKKVLVVTDLSDGEAKGVTDQVKSFLSVLGRQEVEAEWEWLKGNDFSDVHALLNKVQEIGPDLIVTWRHLHSTAWQWPYSLGEYLDVLTQVTEMPVLVLPHPEGGHALAHSLENTDRVMVMTSHMTGDDLLVNLAMHFTNQGGTLFLTDIEDGNGYDRMIDAISKIPMIDTETARESILEQILKEPRDYIASCKKYVEREGIDLVVEGIVKVGHQLKEYEKLITSYEVDLLIMHTKDKGQLAMHGLSYALAVEMRQIPLLLV